MVHRTFSAITTIRAGIDRRLFDNKVLEQVVRSVKHSMPKEYINDVRKGWDLDFTFEKCHFQVFVDFCLAQSWTKCFTQCLIIYSET